MTKEELWESLCAKSPELRKAETKVLFTSENLRLLLFQVYNQGVKQGLKNGQSLPDHLFKTLFGL